MYCRQCGHPLYENASFCSFCGQAQPNGILPEPDADRCIVCGHKMSPEGSCLNCKELKKKKNGRTVRIAAACILAAIALLFILPKLFTAADPVRELTVSPVTGRAYRPLAGESLRCTSVDKDFGGTFNEYEPDEGNETITEDGVVIQCKYLINGKQLIGRFNYTPPQPIEKFTPEDIRIYFDAIAESGDFGGEITQKKDFVVKTDFGKSAGVRYKIEYTISGKQYEQYEKLIFIYRNENSFSIYELRYQNEAHEDNEDTAEKFFNSCFIEDVDLKEREP